MEAAIRWSPHSNSQSSRFLIVDVLNNSLRYYELANFEGKRSSGEKSRFKLISHRKKLPNYTAFDWSKTDPNFVAIGSASGEAHVVRLWTSDSPNSGPDDTSQDQKFEIKHQRKCNSIAFSSNNLLATGLDRVRSDCSLNVYNLDGSGRSSSNEPYRKLVIGEAITSIKFLSTQPDLLVAGVRAQCVRLYDLRAAKTDLDHQSNNVMQFSTHCVHNIAVDPLDENYFISAGPSGNPNVCVWDRRRGSRVSTTTPVTDGPTGPVLEFRPGVDNSQSASIWSLRFSGTKRGCFGVLSSSGEIKIVEMAEHSHSSLMAPAYSIESGERGTDWDVYKHYTRVTHHLQQPWYHNRNQGQADNSRIIAYDFMGPAHSSNAGHVIALRMNRDMDIAKIPSTPPLLGLTAIDEIQIHHEEKRYNYRPSFSAPLVAAELQQLQNRLQPSPMPADSSQLDLSDSENPPHFPVPNRLLHDQLLSLGFPDLQLRVSEQLSVLGVQRRRCQEGYLFDFQRNREIVRNDPWLIELWNSAQTFEELASRNGLISDNLDLSYLGIADVLTNSLGASAAYRNLIGIPFNEARVVNAVKGIVQRWSAFTGVHTSYPAHRQLCLAICGEDFDRQRHQQSATTELLSSRSSLDAYRIIVQAVFRGYRSLALDLLKLAVQRKLINNLGLGTIIAGGEVLSEEQREICSWMAEQTEDPYLRALLSYFQTGSWATVVDATELALKDRIAVALRHLTDRSLINFVRRVTEEAVKEGDIEGVILTGLSDTAVQLFQNYVIRTSDLQTAVLFLAPASTNYITDPRFEYWKETYFMQMQSWRCFIERTRFISQLNRRAAMRPDKALNGTKSITRPPVTLRCMHCQASLAQDAAAEAEKLKKEASFNSSKPASPKGAAGTICPSCGRPMPRCGICMLWLGAPDPVLLPKPNAPNESVASVNQARENRRDPLEAQIMWCMKCLHGFHGHHAKEWFGRHRVCAVPDCECVCGALH